MEYASDLSNRSPMLYLVFNRSIPDARSTASIFLVLSLRIAQFLATPLVLLN